MPVLLILLVVAVIELAVLIAVGQAIGVLATVGLLILASLAGTALVRRAGTRTRAAFTEAVRTRRPPHRELADGMLIVAAGVLIVLPGFVSDALGLLLLLPPIRALARRRMLRFADRSGPVRYGSAPYRSAGPVQYGPTRYEPGTVIEGEIVDESPTPRSGSDRSGSDLR